MTKAPAHKNPVRFEDHGDGLLEVRTGFCERCFLRVRSGKLLDEGDVALRHRQVDSRPVGDAGIVTLPRASGDCGQQVRTVFGARSQAHLADYRGAELRE